MAKLRNLVRVIASRFGGIGFKAHGSGIGVWVAGLLRCRDGLREVPFTITFFGFSLGNHGGAHSLCRLGLLHRFVSLSQKPQVRHSYNDSDVRFAERAATGPSTVLTLRDTSKPSNRKPMIQTPTPLEARTLLRTPV